MKGDEAGRSAQAWGVGHQRGVFFLFHAVRSICRMAGGRGRLRIGVTGMGGARRCGLQLACVGPAGLGGGVGAKGRVGASGRMGVGVWDLRRIGGRLSRKAVPDGRDGAKVELR